MKKICLALILSGTAAASWAEDQVWCAYDPIGSQGDITRRLNDIRLYAQQYQVKFKVVTYQKEQQAIQAFDDGKCSGLAASNFNTYRYNQFMGSTAGIGLIPNNRTAKSFLQLLNHPTIEKRLVSKNYEAVGMIPIGTAYMVLKNKKLSRVAQLRNQRIGVLPNNPPQQALVRSVGAQPVYVDLSNAIAQFKQNKIDIVPAPVYGLLPYNLQKEFGSDTQVINFPLAYFGVNLIIKPQAYPANFGRKIRGWFVHNSQLLTNRATQWENHLPAYYWVDVSFYEKQSYDVMVAKIRNQYVLSGYYDAYFVQLMKRLRCMDDPRYFECPIR
ncbi:MULTISPECIES: putative solute-binding protein [Acinetobacter]|jgi:ABC-type amino acid transport substrate-binding protein|uniref:RND transporter n=2 Tax=Acinetobacter TaxID=469 RepID=A0A242U5F8_ACIPI|nr:MULTISPECIES: putative solute-binding protein [Acinetobacter]TDM61484.1 RND transporter [Acinetobacter sp. KU 011TH]TDM61601.1 RND transporter [Acinetobacter sp. KU 013TH]MBJ8502004.1 RND transporter [Acinetobacter pittii]MBJ9892437.1 RND transporter [Acinetobacter pittii]MCU4361938.1 RND transporter [Acinetobacter sp. WU_MDCI_Abxc22]